MGRVTAVIAAVLVLGACAPPPPPATGEYPKCIPNRMVTIEQKLIGLSIFSVRTPVPVATAKIDPVTNEVDVRWDLWPTDQPVPAPEPDRFPVEIPLEMTLLIDGFPYGTPIEDQEGPHVASILVPWGANPITFVPVGGSVEIDVFGPGLRLCSGPIRVTREL
jgi:hypothetical protein